LHQSSPHLLTCRCSRESFLHVAKSSRVTTAEEALARKFVSGELRANLKLALQTPRLSRGLCWLACVHICWAVQLQPVPVSLQEVTFHGDCIARGYRRCLHDSQWQAGQANSRWDELFQPISMQLNLNTISLAHVRPLFYHES